MVINDFVDLFSAEGGGNKIISYEYADRQEEGYKKMTEEWEKP